VVHVAGTNGKGSTIAFLKAILEAAGYKVHRYISPHIREFNERIHLAGADISDAYLHEMVEQTRLAAGDLQLTFFEGTTAAAFLAFSKVKADVLLLETGLGGRLDATNVVEEPLVSVITPISFDHMEYLGDTIAKIAYEKAGIIKPNCPVVVSWQPQEAQKVILEKCMELDSQAIVFGQHWEGFAFKTPVSQMYCPKPSLDGIHQYINAATAVATIKCLYGFNISDEYIAQGISSTYWPARMEKITRGVLHSMLPSGWELWVDGAHNVGGAEMVAAHIKTQWQDKPTYLINGRTGQRDIAGFLNYFKGLVEFVCGVKVVSEPLGELAINIVNGSKVAGLEAFECGDLKEAFDTILKKAQKPGRILICGSLYLAADVARVNLG
jgi:dihydrofolate synthase / folylpolyglutamate synthase